MKLPWVSRAAYNEYSERFDNLLRAYDDLGQRMADLHCVNARLEKALENERERYERLALRLVPEPPAMPADADPAPLPAEVEAALTALGLTGAERAVEAAAAREMLRQHLPVEDVVATLWRGGPSEAGVTYEH